MPDTVVVAPRPATRACLTQEKVQTIEVLTRGVVLYLRRSKPDDGTPSKPWVLVLRDLKSNRLIEMAMEHAERRRLESMALKYGVGVEFRRVVTTTTDLEVARTGWMPERLA